MDYKIDANKCNIVANLPFYAGLLMNGELNTGEAIYFKMNLSVMWNVMIEHREDGLYNVVANNDTNLNSIDSTFVTKTSAILFCVNCFNENVYVENKYDTAESLLEHYASQFDYRSREYYISKELENALNVLGFDNQKFAETIATMHPTLQQNLFRLITRCILFMADNTNRNIDGRNKASYEGCKKLSTVMDEMYIPYI